MASFHTEGPSHVLVEVSPDIHICGFCKQQYNNFELFLAHKQSGCQIPPADQGPSPALSESGTTLVFEEAFQACVAKVVRKNLSRAQKRMKPAAGSVRRSCAFSGCTFKTQYGQKDMERHLKTHTGEKPFECELCHKRFSRRDKLNMHSRSHTGEKPHKCRYCAYAAADSSSLKKHLRIHYDERPFKCQICPYASRNSSQLTVHLRSHTGDCPFQCNQCEAKFKINSDLKRHVRVHSGEKPYKCDFCDYRCAMKGNLKSHVQIKHGTGDALRCPDCDFRCSSKAALRQHSRQHQPALPVRCPECSYSCSSKGALKIHERVHSDERPFRCEHCGFSSKQRSNLLIHRKKSHAGEGGAAAAGKAASSRYRARLEATRAFRCDACDASFVREDSLRSHRRQHQQSGFLQLSPAQGPAQLHVPADRLAAYAGAQLKIIVTPQLGQEAAAKSPLGPMVQQVSLVLPPAEDALEQPAFLLTHAAAATTATSLQQRLGGDVTPTFITTCSDLDGLTALIQEGGTEVTVVTEGTAPTGQAFGPPVDEVTSSLSPDVASKPGESVQTLMVPLSLEEPQHIFSDSGHSTD
ncbi:zinc finger protein 64 [Denticeps clupeoides]|uniref:zinc finger protein 64 n=1 Tax=Denticeps clupeoides TaxID=299321 RepID=UPI0010A44BA0|nr:zinc finger protein 64 [Denticeps clupeoides]